MNYIMKIDKYNIKIPPVDIDVDVEHLINLNSELNNELTYWKNKIDNDPSWDQFKKFTNEYEFIISRNDSCNKKKPLSRSYFKLWEILHDFDIIKNDITVAHIAEGPGGFIESLCDYITKYNITCENIYGITLLSSDRKIPNWKLSNTLLNTYPICLNSQHTNIGDLYDITNIDKFISTVGYKKCEFVTADGGFDFSKDFNNQENTFYKLLLCEIYTTLSIQKTGGTFLVKVFDLFQHHTIKLLCCCKAFYSEMYIIKPNTSRPANSEKYILFKGFEGLDTSNKHEIVNELRKHIVDSNHDMTFDYKYLPDDLYYMMLDCVTKYNIYYTFRQISYIKKTLDLVELKNNDEDKYKSIIKTINNKNTESCNKWCEKYKLCI